MDLNQFLINIFPSKDTSCSTRKLLEYDNLQEHLDEIMACYNSESKGTEPDAAKRAMEDGLIGPEVVGVDWHSMCGRMVVKHSLEVESQSNFSSIRANICAFKGKWMYEVLLGSKGIMQLGWSTIKCKFTNEEGVGDAADSFAFDGHRVRKWNVSTSKYGEEWMAGDIIGCSIDLDEGTIAYSRNGQSLGTAFDNVRIGPGFAYFPAVSLSYGECCLLNFGSTPFRYPLEGYRPLQDPPSVDLSKARELMSCLDRFLPGPERVPQLPASLHSRAPTFTLLTAAHVFNKLAPLLSDAYIVEDVLLPFLLQSCSDSPPLHDHDGITRVLNLMWACMEEFEIWPCLEHLLWGLIKAYWYGGVNMDFKSQCHHLTLALGMLWHEKTRKLWIAAKIFPQKFAYFMHIRPPGDKVLKVAFPVVWWESTDSLSAPPDSAREQYMEAFHDLNNKVAVLESIQVEMCKILLKKDDKTSMDGEATRTLFLDKFRKFLQEVTDTAANLSGLTCRLFQLQPANLNALGPVTTCFFHRLVQGVRWHWDQWTEANSLAVRSEDGYIPGHVFYDGSINYFDLSRLGGLISHLKKSHSEKLKTLPGHVSGALSSTQDSSSSTTGASNDDNMDMSLVETLDGIIMLYHLAVHKQLSKVRGVRDNMQQNIRALADTNSKINRCPPERTDVMAELQRAKTVFTDETKNCVRHMTWVSSLIFTKQKQSDVHWVLSCLLRCLEKAKANDIVFEFVPECYIEATVNTFHALRHFFHPTADFSQLRDPNETLNKVALFLSSHFADSRIVNPDLRDTVIQSLAAYVCYPDSLHSLENMDSLCQQQTIKSLMAAYEKRAWVQTTWILVRMWKGNGFAFRYTNPPDYLSQALPEQGHLKACLQAPCPSPLYQQLLGEICLENPQLSSDFLNGILNQLNWAFSEFIGMLQEAANRLENILDSRQLRTCAVCFDLTVGLLRVLEMVSTVAPRLFTDWKNIPSAELAIARLFQLLTQVLNRVTASANLFDNVTRLRLPGLETVDRFPVLSAVTGILIVLLMEGTKESQECACLALFSEPGFQLESLEFLMGGNMSFAGKPSAGRFSFRNYGEVTTEEVEEVERMVSYLSEESTKPQFTKQLSVDGEEVCPICYAMPLSVSFKPCGHSSCRACITRHLMNNKQCFFCKETVEEVETVRK